MVREGQAVNYCKYLNKNCWSNRTAYITAATAAQKEGLGVWNLKQPWTQMRESHPCLNDRT
jgi:endonuclease YncB( thermonuclease family)